MPTPAERRVDIPRAAAEDAQPCTPQGTLCRRRWVTQQEGKPEVCLRGGGLEPKKVENFVYQKQPKSIFLFVNFISSNYEIRVQGGGGANTPHPRRC